MKIFLITYLNKQKSNFMKSNKKTKPAKKATNKKTTKKVVTTVTTTTTITTSVTPKETHYLLILDESGSMSSVRKETLSGLNEQIQTIKSLDKQYPDQDYFISIVKFDDVITPLFENIPASEIREITPDDYNPDGSTRLYDAIGTSVNKLNSRIQSKIETGEASALVVILTDGMENASKEYKNNDYSDPAKIIRELLSSLEKSGMWTMTFMGANQNAVLTAKDFGINAQNAVTYTSSGVGTGLAFATVNSALKKRAAYTNAGVYASTTDCFLSSVTDGLASLGENAELLDLTGTISDADIKKAKKDLNKKGKSNS